MYVLCECVSVFGTYEIKFSLFYLLVFSELSVYVKSEDVNDEL